MPLPVVPVPRPRDLEEGGILGLGDGHMTSPLTITPTRVRFSPRVNAATDFTMIQTRNPAAVSGRIPTSMRFAKPSRNCERKYHVFVTALIA